MEAYSLSKDIGSFKFKIFLEIDFDNFGNIESYEFYDGFFYYGNPSDILFSKVFCDESKQDEWNIFLNDLLQLFEEGLLFKIIKKLKKEEDSYYFSENNIELIKIEL